MANEIKNQEFNKHIKQLQSMIGDKQIITLAENYYNLKVEMTALIRSVKEKENSLIAKKKAENTGLCSIYRHIYFNTIILSITR